ncbi:MAG: C10 family peptidase, partial [Muribaculaceae bacterium]|nr:C10 family peptidase [Muribaculaceae bacterium]
FKHMPPQLKALLNQFAENATKSGNWNGIHPSWNAPGFSTRADEGVLLETADWGQGAPYNADCPNMGEYNAPTGCVATAMAIVMKYHKWPETYNWDAMPMKIKQDSENPPAPNPELARLMKDAGEAVFMEYGPTESGAYIDWIGHRLQQVFKYSPDCQFITLQNFTDEEWHKMLKTNIDNNSPVIYNGSGSGNHAFIVDGYNNNQYHINWGWDGWYNGFFALDALTPNEAQDYSKNQGMVMNIVPDKTGKEYSDWFVDYGYLFAGLPSEMTISVVNVKPGETFHIGGISPQVPANFVGEYGIALVSKDGDIKEILKSQPYTNTESKLCSFSYSFTDLKVIGEIASTDRLQLVSKAAGDANYKLILGTIENPSYLNVVDNTPKFGKITFNIEEGITFSYITGINDREQIVVPTGNSEADVLKGLLFEYSCNAENLPFNSRIILSIKGNLIYGDQIYSVKQFSTFFEVLGEYEISAKIVELKEKTIELAAPGTLKDIISKEEGHEIKNLTITGKMDATDFWYLRDNFPSLEYLDIRKVDIEAVTATDNKYFESDGNNLENVIPEWALQALMNLQTLILPENLAGIANDSLGALALTGITIPAGVSFIGLNVLFSNANLEYVCMLNPEPVHINDCVFTGTPCPENGTLYVPVGSIDKYKEAPVWKDFKNIKEGTIPEIIKYAVIKDDLIYNCKFEEATLSGYEGEPKNIIVPETFVHNGTTITVNKISASAFANCSTLESISIPNSVTEIGEFAFNNCENLTSAKLSDAITVIPVNTFLSCINLQDIEISPNVKEIQISAFCNTAIQSVTLPKDITLGDWAFMASPNLRDVIFKGNPKRGIGTFDYCPELKNFIIDSDEVVELDGIFDQPKEIINIFSSSPTKNFTYSDNCVIFVPGQCTDNFAGTRASTVYELWRYNINRKDKKLEVVPQFENLVKIDKVTINGKVVTPQNDIYPIEDTDNIDVKVEYTLLDRQKATTHYSAQFNNEVKDAVVTGMQEIFNNDSALMEVYTTDGILCKKGCSKEDLKDLRPGIYIIRQGSKTRKVVITK